MSTRNEVFSCQGVRYGSPWPSCSVYRLHDSVNIRTLSGYKKVGYVLSYDLFLFIQLQSDNLTSIIVFLITKIPLLIIALRYYIFSSITFPPNTKLPTLLTQHAHP